MRRAIVALTVLAFLLTGCQQATQKAVEQASGAQVNQKGDTVTIKGQDGQSVTISSEVPDALKNFPAPQGFKISESGSMAGDKANGNLAMASWQGKGSVKDVSDFYKKSMVDQGWKQESALDAEDMSQLQYTKGQNQAVVTISSETDGVAVQVMLTNTPAK